MDFIRTIGSSGCTWIVVGGMSMTLLRLVQTLFSERRTLTLEAKWNSEVRMVRRVYTIEWGAILQERYAQLTVIICVLLGIQRNHFPPRVIRVTPRFRESAQDYNRRLCLELLPEIKPPHWLSNFSDLGEQLEFFYQENLTQSFYEKQQILHRVLYLNNLRKEKGHMRTLCHRELLAVVHVVVGDSLQQLSVSHCHAIENVWSFFRFLIDQKASSLISDLCHSYRLIFERFIKTLASFSGIPNLCEEETVNKLKQIVTFVQQEPAAYYALPNHETSVVHADLAATLDAIMKTLNSCVTQQTEPEKRLQVKLSLGKRATQQQVNILYTHYESQWSVFPLQCYLEALLSLASSQSKSEATLQQWANHLAQGKSPPQDKMVKASCKRYIIHFLKIETRLKDPESIGPCQYPQML